MRVIHVLRKPLSERTVAANTLKHGTGGLNIDASRISTSDDLNGGAYSEGAEERWDGAENWRYKRGEHGNAGEYIQPEGRWPSNLILEHDEGCRCVGTISHWECAPGCPVASLDEQTGAVRSAGHYPTTYSESGGYTNGDIGRDTQGPLYNDKGGASRFYKQVGGDK